MSRLLMMIVLISVSACASLQHVEVKQDTAFERKMDLRNIRTDRVR